MTLNEFRAWLDGFCEALSDAAPNANQWRIIKSKFDLVKEFPSHVFKGIHSPVSPQFIPCTPLINPLTLPQPNMFVPTLPGVTWCCSGALGETRNGTD